jgi:hypothetical protein
MKSHVACILWWDTGDEKLLPFVRRETKILPDDALYQELLRLGYSPKKALARSKTPLDLGGDYYPRYRSEQ